MKELFIFGGGVVFAAFLAGCGNAGATAVGVKPGDDPAAVAMLQKSMDVYAAAPSFSAQCDFSMDFAGFPSPSATRTISYEKPNRFKVVSSSAMGFVQTCISDGKDELEFDNKTGQDPRKQSAPDAIADAKGMQMRHPMFCGTLLYQFFGGASNYDHLVDTSKGPVTFGAEETAANGEKAKVVKFYGTQQYGHVEALIGEKTGYVYRIKYDSEPLVKEMQDPKMQEKIQSLASSGAAKAGQDQGAKQMVKAAISAAAAAPTLSYTTVETYLDIASPATIASDAFALVAPKGSTPIDMSDPGGMDKPPVPLGSMAPDFTVTSLDGKTVKLSSLRGHPVMLDFWATWCGPCVASLPHTQEVFSKGKSAGLQVYAISDEDKATVSTFIKKNKYTFPTALDTTRDAEKAYKTEAIPTTVVIDSNGKLVAYIVGGGRDADIAAALKKVGVALD